MATFQSFEEIEAWGKARLLTREIYVSTARDRFSKDFGLSNQIRRAVVSVMSNIAEGFERNGTREFIQFLSVAKGSIGEIKSQLYIALDQQYISPEDFRKLTNLANDTGQLIGGLIRYLKQTEMKGHKYKTVSDHDPTSTIHDFEGPYHYHSLNTLNPKHQTRNPKPETLNPKLKTRNLKPANRIEELFHDR